MSLLNCHERAAREHDYNLCSAWHMLRATHRHPEAEDARRAAEAKGIEVLQVTRGRIGRFVNIPAWTLRTPDGVAAFPLESPTQVLERVQAPRRESRREFWASVGWFQPAYISNGAMAQLRQALLDAPIQRREAVLAEQLAVLYTELHFASMIESRYPQLPEFADHLPLIREAAEAFCSRMQRVAITALVPVVEGLLRRFLTKLRPQGSPAGGFDLMKQVIEAETTRAIAKLVYHGTWVPPEYREREFNVAVDEYLGMLATFEYFGAKHFFAQTDDFDADHGLNRHYMLHGSLRGCENPQNFLRLWSILDMLAFAVTMSSSGVSALAPDITPEARNSALQLRLRSVLPALCERITTRALP